MILRGFCVVFLLLTISGCASTTETDDIVWYFQVAAPKNYEVWVNHLELKASDILVWHQAPGAISCCWKGEGGPRGKGGRMEPFPNQIEIEWFSYSEQIFYQRSIVIHQEWKERMLRPATYYTSQGAFQGPRNTLILGLAPGGKVVIWMKNQIGNEIELARLQANAAEGDSSHYQSRSRAYLERRGDYLKNHGIPLEGW